MKTFRTFIVPFILLFCFSAANQSCQSTRKTALSCPEFSIKKSDFRAYNPKHHSQNRLSKIDLKAPARKHKTVKPVNTVSNPALPVVTYVDNYSDLDAFDRGLLASAQELPLNPLFVDLIPVANTFPTGVFDDQPIVSMQQACDTIMLKSGGTIVGKVEEIGQTEIKYRKCNNLTGPLISLSLYEVASIKYANGTSDSFNSPIELKPRPADMSGVNTSQGRLEGLGLAGFIAGLAGIFVASIPLGIIAIIFGTISLSKIRRNPQKHKGKGFAIVSLILGLIEVIGMLIILNSL